MIFDETKFSRFVVQYKHLLQVDKYDELYKWKNLKIFQDNWDLDAQNLKEMYESSFADANCNLWCSNQYWPRKMMVEFCGVDQNAVREMFRNLFDEKRAVIERMQSFEAAADHLLKRLERSDRNRAYQDPRALALYLTFKYPEKYYLYKASMFDKFVNRIGYKTQSGNGKFAKALDFFDVADHVRDLLKKDAELVKAHRARLTADCYQDPNCNMLAQDFIYAVGEYFGEETVLDIKLDGHRVFKISHGTEQTNFSDERHRWFVDNRYISMSKKTRPPGTSTISPGKVFLDDLTEGDYFYLCRGNQVELIGRIIGAPTLVSDQALAKNEYYQRKFELLKEATEKKGYHGDVKWWTPNGNTTIQMIPENELTLANEKLFIPFFDAQFLKSGMVSEQKLKFAAEVADNDEARNVILYGPPGTGKTFKTIEYAVRLAGGDSLQEERLDRDVLMKEYKTLKEIGQIEFITFHQNYAYEDFMVGLKPDVAAGNLRFDTKEGVFKQLSDRARRNWLSSTQQNSAAKVDFDRVLNSFFGDLIQEELKKVEIPMRSKGFKFAVTSVDQDLGKIKFTKQSGGTGHDLLIKNVRGIYEGTLNYGLEGLGVYYYPLVEKLKEHGSKLASETAGENLKNFVLVIDEINRANISRVFGELITLLEEDKRLGKPNEMTITMPNGERDFGVPPNLFVVGTMNTADRSIALVDVALRRRFEFRGLYPTHRVIDQLVDDGMIAPAGAQLLKTMNEKIFSKKGSDFLIGHAYLIGRLTGEQIVETIERKIIPLLLEYFAGKQDSVVEIFEGSGFSVSFDASRFEWVIKNA